MRKGLVRYWLWLVIAYPIGWIEWGCTHLLLFIEERMFRIEREWDW